VTTSLVSSPPSAFGPAWPGSSGHGGRGYPGYPETSMRYSDFGHGSHWNNGLSWSFNVFHGLSWSFHPIAASKPSLLISPYLGARSERAHHRWTFLLSFFDGELLQMSMDQDLSFILSHIIIRRMWRFPKS
jgi:hypothetical protein